MKAKRKVLKVKTKGPEETRRLARDLASKLSKGTTILLYGELGAGKTTFVQGLAEGLGVPEEVYVSSPTFSLINEYPGRQKLYHVDLYRLAPEEVEDLGLPELASQGVMVIEWAERLPFSFPQEMIIKFKILSPEERELEIEEPS